MAKKRNQADDFGSWLQSQDDDERNQGLRSVTYSPAPEGSTKSYSRQAEDFSSWMDRQSQSPSTARYSTPTPEGVRQLREIALQKAQMRADRLNSKTSVNASLEGFKDYAKSQSAMSALGNNGYFSSRTTPNLSNWWHDYGKEKYGSWDNYVKKMQKDAVNESLSNFGEMARDDRLRSVTGATGTMAGRSALNFQNWWWDYGQQKYGTIDNYVDKLGTIDSPQSDETLSYFKDNLEVPDGGDGNHPTNGGYWAFMNNLEMPDGGDMARAEYASFLQGLIEKNNATNEKAQARFKRDQELWAEDYNHQVYMDAFDQALGKAIGEMAVKNANNLMQMPGNMKRYNEALESYLRDQNAVTGSYIIDQILGYEPTEAEPLPENVQKIQAMSPADIKTGRERYDASIADDIQTAKDQMYKLGLLQEGMTVERSDAMDKFGEKWGIDPYDYFALKKFIDQKERGVVYETTDGKEITWTDLYNNAVNREKEQANALPASEQEYISQLMGLSSSQLEQMYNSYDSTDYDNLEEDIATARALLMYTGDEFKDMGGEIGELRSNFKAKYPNVNVNDYDSLNSFYEELQAKMRETPDPGDREVIFQDSNGNLYTYEKLYYDAENREKFKQMETDDEALELMVNGYKVKRMIDSYEGALKPGNLDLPEGFDIENYSKQIAYLQVSLDAIANQLSEKGYDFNRMSEYLDTEDAKQNYIMQAQADAEFARKRPLLAALYTVALMPQASLDVFLNTTGSGDATDPLSERVPKNYWSMQSINTRETIRETQGNDIYNAAYNAFGSETFADLAKKVYSGAMSIADSRFAFNIGNTLLAWRGEDFVKFASLAIMGSTAAGSEMKQSIAMGRNNGQVFTAAFSAGINEALFEVLSLDHLMKNVDSSMWDWDNVFASVKKALTQSFTQRAIEGSEEVFTSIANTITQGIIDGDHSKFRNRIESLETQRGISPEEAERIAGQEFLYDLFTEDFLGGFIAGGGELTYILAAANSSPAFQQMQKPVVDNVDNRYYQDIGSAFVRNQNVEPFVQQAQQSDNLRLRELANDVVQSPVYIQNTQKPAVEKPNVQNPVQEQQQNQPKVQKPTKKQQQEYKIAVGKLGAESVKENAQTVLGKDKAALNQIIKNDLKNRGMEADSFTVDVISQVYNGEKIENMSTYAQNVAQKVNAEELAESLKERAPEINEVASKISTEAAARVENVLSMATDNYNDSVSETGETVNLKTGDPIELTKIVSNKNGNMVIETKDGERINADDIQFANTTQAALYDAVRESGVDPQSANTIALAFNGNGTFKARSYVAGMLEGMGYGNANMTQDMASDRGFFADLTPAQKNLAIELGQQEREAKISDRFDEISRQIPANPKPRKAGRLINVPSGLTDIQQQSVDFMDALTKHGLIKNNIHFFMSEAKDGDSKVRVLTEDVGNLKKFDANGNQTIAPNGFYDPRTGDIYIDLNAGNSGEGSMLFTLGHEVTHFIKDWSPNKFNDLASFLVKEYHGAGVDVDTLVRNQIEKNPTFRELRVVNPDKAYQLAFEEMVADSMQTMFTDGNVAEKLARLQQQDPSLFEKIKQWFLDLAQAIKDIYANLKPGSMEGETIQQIQNSIDKLADLFAEGVTAATENYSMAAPDYYAVTGENMSDSAAFADSKSAVMNQIRTPYTEGTNAWREFIDGLNPEARKTHDLFYNFYTSSKLTNAKNMQGKTVKSINISSVFLTAQQWNAKIGEDAQWRECAKKMAASLPENVRKNMNFNLDGTLTPVALETRFKMQKSMAQRLVDSLGYEKIDNTYELGGKKFTLNTAGSTQSVGGEAYRRALINETRKLYEAGKLKKVSIGTMSKDRWGSLGFLAANEKTGASGDLTTLCPQMMYNEGCFYCYRRAALETGVNNKLVAQSVWYTGEILRIKDTDIDELNKKGGLRIQSFGDWMPHFSAQLADILYDAETRGLQVKIITKEPSMIDYVARLRDQGLGLNLYFNISADYAIEKGPAQLDNFNPDSLARVNTERPFMRDENNTFWWKRALTVEEGAAIRQKYPWVNVRIVATTQDEFVRGLKDPNVQVVTGYHGNIRQWERVDSTTGEKKVIVEALGDNGMPRFRYENGQWTREYDGKTKTHQALANAIEANNLQQEYYIKTCCITGRCVTCQGKCGAYANSFYVKNATNDPAGTAYWYNNMSNVQLEETNSIEVEPELKLQARDAQWNVVVDDDVTPETVRNTLEQINNLPKKHTVFTFPIMKTTPRIYSDLIGLEGTRSLVMSSDKAWNVIRGKHGMGIDGFMSVIDKLDRPGEIIIEGGKNKGHYASIIYGDNGEALAALDFDSERRGGSGTINGENGYYDALITTYDTLGENTSKYYDTFSQYIEHLEEEAIDVIDTYDWLNEHKKEDSDITGDSVSRLGDHSESSKMKSTTPETGSQETNKNSLRDSEGNALSQEQSDYFKDSKIRDDDGNLLVVYHGTDAEFTVFDRTKGRSTMDIQGMFFSPWDIDAAGYGPNVGAYYLNIKNPAPEGLAYRALNLYEGQNNAGVKAREYLEKKGYDGVNNGNEEFIAFYPEQIKLVENRAPTVNPDIRFSERDPDALDTRTLLSNALLETAQNDVERKYIADYQAKIEAMNEEQRKLNELRSELNGLFFSKDKSDKQRYSELSQEANKLANRINIYDKQLLRLEAMAPMNNVVKRERARVKTRIKNKIETQMTNNKLKTSIQNEVKGLSNRLLHQKAKTVIPDVFKSPVLNFLKAIDFTTFTRDGQVYPGKANVTRAQLRESLNQLSKEFGEDGNGFLMKYGFDLAPEVQLWIDKTLKDIENILPSDEDVFYVNKMSTEELKDLEKTVKALRVAVNQASRTYMNSSSSVEDLGESSIGFMEPMFNRKHFVPARRLFKPLGWDYAQPATAFERFGEGGKKIFRGLMNGQKKEAQNVQKILDFVQGAYTREEVNKWREELVTVETQKGTYEVPVSYLMELYSMIQDDDAKRHILEGGIRFDDLEIKRSGNTYDDVRVTSEEVENMLSILDKPEYKRAKEVADKLHEFMDRVGADWGNEVSARRFGYEAFGENPNYYPIRTIKAGSDYEAKQKRANIYALLNKSFTKERDPNAKNTAVVGDMFETFNNHMSEMALYNAWALPVIDTIKWFNYKDNTGDTERSVQRSMKKAYGGKNFDPAVEYVSRLLESINGQRSGGLSQGWAFNALRMVNRVAVAGNIRVAVQQPFSITRAFEMINPKYVKVTSKKTRDADYEEMLKYSSFGRWKDLGYFDVNVTKPMEGEILKNDTWADRFTEKTMTLAEKGDQFTWATLWHACKLEAQTKGLEGEDLINAAAEKFDDLITHTQVVDSVLTKSQWMRADDFWHRMTSSFMSEPMTSYNTLLRRFDQFQRDKVEHGLQYAIKNNLRNILATCTVFALTQFVNALVTAPIDASRDDDDYKTWFEKFMEKLKRNTKENFTIANLMPYIADIVEYIEYGSEDRSDMAMYTRIIDTAKMLGQVFDKEKYSVKKLHKLFNSALTTVSSLTGLPLSNMWRDVTSIWNTAVGDILGDGFKIGTDNWKYQTGETLSAFGYEAFIKALENNNSERAAYVYMQMIENGLDNSGKLNNNILSYFRKNASGDYDDAGNEEMLGKIRTFFGENEEADMTDEERAWWIYTGEHPDTFLANSSSFKSYYEKIMPYGISADVYNEYRQQLIDNNYSVQAEKVKVIDSLDITREQKDALYLSEGWQKIGLENTPWHASATPGWGDYTKRALAAHLENYMSASDYREYLTEIEPYGIDDFTWTEYANFISDVKGIDTTGDGKNDVSAQELVNEYIDALPLTDQQKDVLYLKKYKEKNLDKAPWHKK